MPGKELMIRIEVIDYWIDREEKKAYCIIKFVDMLDKGKHSNIRLTESEYHGK